VRDGIASPRSSVTRTPKLVAGFCANEKIDVNRSRAIRTRRMRVTCFSCFYAEQALRGRRVKSVAGEGVGAKVEIIFDF
jgi:hypothetical protein